MTIKQQGGVFGRHPTFSEIDVDGNAEISGDLTVSNKIIHQGDADTFLSFAANNTWSVTTQNEERLRIDSDGKFGFNTNSPDYNYQFFAEPEDIDILVLQNAVDNTVKSEAGISFLPGTSTSNPSARISALEYDPSDSRASLLFYTRGTNANDPSTERVRITHLGDVGINEDAPNYKLDVNGDFGFTPGSSVNPADNGDVVFELTNNTTLTIKAKGSDGVVRSGTINLS